MCVWFVCSVGKSDVPTSSHALRCEDGILTSTLVALLQNMLCTWSHCLHNMFHKLKVKCHPHFNFISSLIIAKHVVYMVCLSVSVFVCGLHSRHRTWCPIAFQGGGVAGHFIAAWPTPVR